MTTTALRAPVTGWRVTVPAAAGLYLAAAVAANLLVAHYGIAATPFVAFALVGADLTTRDTLHDSWSGRGLLPRMGALILAGAALSWLVNPASGRVALASVVAFLLAGAVDAGAYHLARHADRSSRVMASNIAGAIVDSLAFVLVAFGTVGTPTFHQATAKVAGGAVWLLVLARRR